VGFSSFGTSTSISWLADNYRYTCVTSLCDTVFSFTTRVRLAQCRFGRSTANMGDMRSSGSGEWILSHPALAVSTNDCVLCTGVSAGDLRSDTSADARQNLNDMAVRLHSNPSLIRNLIYALCSSVRIHPRR